VKGATRRNGSSRSIIRHVSVGVADIARAAAFYDSVMAAIGASRMMEASFGIVWGKALPEFWVTTPHDAARRRCA